MNVLPQGDVLTAFTFSTVLVLLSFLLSPTAFSPLQASANYDSMARPKFSLVDLAVLVIQVQVLAAMVLSAEPNSQNRPVILVWCGVPLAMWWFGGVRLLTCAGIQRAWYRVFFLFVVAPLGFLMAFSLSSVLLLLMFGVYAFCAALVLRDFSAFLPMLGCSGIFAAVVGVLVLIRATCRMMVTERLASPSGSRCAQGG